MLQDFKAIQAHGRSELTSLCLLSENKLASAGNDSCVRIWDLRSLQVERCVRLKQSYLGALCAWGSDLLVGNGDGELMFLDSTTLTLKHALKLHTDCLTHITPLQNTVLTASSDGSLAFLDPLHPSLRTQLPLGSPLTQLQPYNNSYYVAGVKSFEVDSSLKVRSVGNISRFLAAGGQLYGTNDEKGFMCVSRKFNTYVPCENMMEFGEGVLGTSWGALAYFTGHPEEERISYSSTRVQFLEGDSILALAGVGKRVFAGSECGNLYSFALNTDFHWYDQD